MPTTHKIQNLEKSARTHYSPIAQAVPSGSDNLQPLFTRYFTPNSNLSQPSFNLDAISNLVSEQQRKFIEFGQGPRVEVGISSIQQAIEIQIKTNPQAIAVEHEGRVMSYAELDQRSEMLAIKLQRLGIHQGHHVGLFVERSIEMIVGLLAILKTGAAYVPQDVRIAPPTSLLHIMQCCTMPMVLTLSDWEHRIPVVEGIGKLCIDQFLQSRPETSTDPETRLDAAQKLSPDRTCFILFTSGTTGLPNGVQVTHRNLCNIILTSPGNLDITTNDRVAQILNIAFDMAAWEIFSCLCHGATLLIRGSDIQATADKASIIIATPSILGTLDASRCPQLRVVAVAGEPCSKPLADYWSQYCQFYNCCGPTETTIVNTMQAYDSVQGHLTIGKPTANNTVYILDENLRPSPMGEVGEMWAGGDCVTTGYLANDLLSAQRYKSDPFLGDGRKMFRTRDLGRWTENGELEHLGRTDDQVKIKGFRVELDSVSSALEKESSCIQAVTIKLDSQCLVSFLRPSGASVELARASVEKSLAYYCMPEFIVTMDQFPLTSRGKIDKPELIEIANQYAEAATLQLEKGSA